MGQVFAEQSEVRWNGIEGPLLGRASQPNFTVSVVVPRAEPGLYQIVGFERTAGGAVGNLAQVAFEVTAPNGGPSGTGPPAQGGSAARGTTVGSASSTGGTVVALAVGVAIGLLVAWAVRIARRRSARSPTDGV